MTIFLLPGVPNTGRLGRLLADAKFGFVAGCSGRLISILARFEKMNDAEGFGSWYCRRRLRIAD
jgi:hypothetical protein